MDAMAPAYLRGGRGCAGPRPNPFAEQSFKATSTRAVTARAGLSPALVIRHFGSKQDLRVGDPR